MTSPSSCYGTKSYTKTLSDYNICCRWREILKGYANKH